MKLSLLIALLVVFASSVHLAHADLDRVAAFKALPSCYKGARFTDDWLVASIKPRVVLARPLRERSRAVEQRIELSDEVTDLHVMGDDLYALTLSDIEHWDLLSGRKMRVIQTHRSAQPDYPPYYSARGFAFHGQRIYVAHERYGVSLIDLRSGVHLASLELPGEAMDVTFSPDGAVGYVLSESVELSGSEILGAILSFDPLTLRPSHQTLLQGAPDGSLELFDGAFYIGSHFYWKVGRATVDRARLVKSQDRLIIPEGYAHGKPFIDAANIYSCSETGSPVVTARAR